MRRPSSTPASACASTSRRARSRTSRAATGSPSATSASRWWSGCARCWLASRPGALRRQLRGERRVELGEEPALVAAPVAGQRVDVERELVAAAGELLDRKSVGEGKGG